MSVSRRSPIILATAMTLALAGLLVGLLLFDVDRKRRAALDEAMRQAVHYAQLYGEHVSHSLNTVEIALAEIGNAVIGGGPGFAERAPRLLHTLRERGAHSPKVRALRLYDAEGRLVAQSGSAGEQHRIFDFDVRPAHEVAEVLARTRDRHESHVQCRHRIASNDVRDVEIFGSPIEIGGRLLLHAIIHDITERKALENRLRAAERRLVEAIESIEENFWLWGRDDRLVLANSRFAQRYPEVATILVPGVPFEEAMNAMLPLVDCAGSGLTPQAWMEERCRTHREGGSMEVATVDGRWYLVEERQTEEGGRVTLQTDITELKRRELSLIEAQRRIARQAADLAVLAEDRDRARRRAEEANRAKSQFLATMSHELRTPLNAVLGFAEIIRDQTFGPDSLERYVEYAGYIHESGSHLLDLINDILDVAKIEAGKLEIESQLLDLRAILNASVRLVEVRALTTGLAISIELPDPPPLCYADERAIKQILFNLLSNAIKFSSKGGTIRLRVATDAEGAVEISVVDEGIGIPQDHLERVLEPFERVDNSYARAMGGTGLGLALVKGLVKLHGADFRLESQLGVGTTATVRFPPPPHWVQTAPSVLEKRMA